MAIINQIGGISTGGLTGVLKGPLDKLFGTTNKPFMYQYPANLGNDPSRMHIVKFTISEIVPKKFDIKQTINGLVDQATRPVAADVPTGTTEDNEARKKAAISRSVNGNAVAMKSAAIAKNLEAFIKPEKKKTETVISLYMPDTLSMNYHAEYSELTLMEATNGLNRVAGAIGSLAEDLMRGGMNMNNMTTALGKTFDEYGVEAGLRLLDRGMNTNVTDLGLKAMGLAVNPQLQLVYKGLGFRTFTMEFVFTPKTKEESDQVSAIVNTFIYASHPTVTGTSGMYFTPPSVFNMEFLMAKSGTFSGLTDMLQKAGNSIIPGVPIGSAIANKLGGGSTGIENDRLYKVGDCVLEDVSVDYAPNGWAAYSGGAPVQTRLTLSFKEIDILDRNRMTLKETSNRVR